MSVDFEPLIPAALWMALAAVAGALLVWYALRRPPSVTGARWIAVIGMMSLAMALVLGILLNPTFVRETPPPPGKPLLTFLIDSSGSMATKDGSGGRSRFEVAAETARDLGDRLQARFDVRVRSFSDVVTARDLAQLAALQPAGNSTDVSSAIAGALESDRPPGQAVLLLSDGIDNAGGGTSRILESARIAKALAAPLYTKTLGGENRGTDLSIELRAPQDLAFIGQRVPLTATIRQIGLASARAEVLLVRDGKEVARRDITLRSDASADVYFMVSQEKTGLYPYEVRVSSPSKELSMANNVAPFLLRVVDEPIRVLLLEGKPYWDSKFLVRTLTSDPAVALDGIVRLADKRLIRRAFSGSAESRGNAVDAPTTRPRLETWKVLPDVGNLLASPDSLRGYQIVVLGRDAETFLTEDAVATLQNWIAQDGGSLVCSRGAPTAQVNQKLGRLMPVSWEAAKETRFRVKLTDQGRNLNWWRGATGGATDGATGGDETTSATDVLGSLPALASRGIVGNAKPLAVVLATGVAPALTTGTRANASGAAREDSPAVVYQPYGTGRVVVIEGAGMWRWAFLPPQYQKREEVYAALWQSLMRWLTSSASLSPGQRMALRADKVSFSTTELATATLLVRDEKSEARDPVRVELTGGSTDASTGEAAKPFSAAPVGDEPGTFRVNFGKLAPGRYQARIAGASTKDPSSMALFDVGDLGAEQLDLTARPDLMRRIATDSGGLEIKNNETDAMAATIERSFDQHMRQTRPPQVQRISAWDRWWILIGVLTVWTASWAVRRSGGLI